MSSATSGDRRWYSGRARRFFFADRFRTPGIPATSREVPVAGQARRDLGLEVSLAKLVEARRRRSGPWEARPQSRLALRR